ncbi:hypothetical protein DVH24_014266 [Malus domestica]|uniref:Uncharacterized protein n=1 Tax=Malus domestica TaxID=3750 RepID=A0A498JDW0_MALDO|nr:hypothetical protein DVH24_014266 [Malus domestica]
MKSPKTGVEFESRFEVLELFESRTPKSTPRTPNLIPKTPNQRNSTLKHGHKTRKQSFVHTTTRWLVAPPIQEED